MQEKFLKYYRSPKKGKLSLIPDHDNGNEIRTGIVVCEKTGERFNIIDGAIHLISTSDINDLQKKDQIEVNTFNRQIDEQKKMGLFQRIF